MMKVIAQGYVYYNECLYHCNCKYVENILILAKGSTKVSSCSFVIWRFYKQYNYVNLSAKGTLLKILTGRVLSKFLASLMRNYFPKRPPGTAHHILSKLYDVPVYFVNPLPLLLGSVLLYLLSPKGVCCSISDDLSCSCLLKCQLRVTYSALFEKKTHKYQDQDNSKRNFYCNFAITWVVHVPMQGRWLLWWLLTQQ